MDRREAAAQRSSSQVVSHRWRFWENARGDKVIAEEIDRLPDEDALSIHAQMIIVRQDGLKAARHLVEDIYEVEAHGIHRSYRLLFSSQGKKGRILLAVVLLEKKTQKTRKPVIELAKKRRDNWRSRGGVLTNIGYDRYDAAMTRATEPDDLDLSIRRRLAANPEYRHLLDAEVRRQRLIRHLVEVRKANGLTQAAVAKAMQVSQSVVAEIESGKGDIRYSTLDRYADAVSQHRLRLELVGT